jgi:hypothetical protein
MGGAFGNKIGQLAQGMSDRVAGINTFFFIKQEEIPKIKKKM